MITPREKQEEIVSSARELFQRYYGDASDHGSCLYWTIAVIKSAHRHGVELCPQAGTAMFRRLPKDVDDQTSNTHFGYEWNGPDTAGALAAIGCLPEIHVWAGRMKTQELVDVTVKYQQERCNLSKDKWLAPDPPDYFWHRKEDMPIEAFYWASEEATRFAVKLMVDEIHAKKGLR